MRHAIIATVLLCGCDLADTALEPRNAPGCESYVDPGFLLSSGTIVEDQRIIVPDPCIAGLDELDRCAHTVSNPVHIWCEWSCEADGAADAPEGIEGQGTTWALVDFPPFGSEDYVVIENPCVEPTPII